MLYGKTNRFPGSRFLSELPEGCYDRKGLTFEKRNVGTIAPDRPYYATRSVAHGAPGSTRPTIAPKPPSPQPLPAFQKGDTVTHKAFGKGLIVGMTPMGGDALLEIAFEGTGTKRLMAKAAAAYLEKA